MNDSSEILICASADPSEQLIEELYQITDKCNQADSTNFEPFFEDNFVFVNKPSLLYALYNRTAVGFLSMDIIDEKTIYICIFVLPEYRGAGIARKLLIRTRSIYSGIPLFVGYHSKDCPALISLGFNYDASECLMSISRDDMPEYILRSAKESPISAITSAESQQYRFSAYLDGKKIGQCRALVAESTASLYNVSIVPEQRNKGYGTDFIAQALLELFDKCDTVLLHVSSINTGAVRLYEKLGFKTIETVHYFCIV